jgi:putative acyl-CoA dehydrogenase
MRRALVEALHHTRHRCAFGLPLAEHALMQNVLADLAIESEAATAFSMRVARAVDASATDLQEAAFARIATAIGKYWICKRAPAFINEAQECLGGAGYVEESILPRLYREAPLNSIWEGCGNVQCLDVLRALAREPQTRAALWSEFESVRGGDALLDAQADALRAQLDAGEFDETHARALVEQLALALQAAVLVRAGNSSMTSAFCRSRLGRERGLVFGSLPADLDFEFVLRRAWPI